MTCICTRELNSVKFIRCNNFCMQHGADEALLLFVWNRPIKGAEGTTQRPQACFGLPSTVENLGGSLASQGVAASGGAPTWALIKPVGEDLFSQTDLSPASPRSKHQILAAHCIWDWQSWHSFSCSLKTGSIFLYIAEKGYASPLHFFSSLWVKRLIKEIMVQMFQLLELELGWCILWYQPACIWPLQMPPFQVAPFWILHFINREWPCAYCLIHSHGESEKLESLLQVIVRFSLPRNQVVWSRSMGSCVESSPAQPEKTVGGKVEIQLWPERGRIKTCFPL